jgi:hypothetical protein
MIVVDTCPECGKPIYGSPYEDDAMSGVLFASCMCADDDGYDVLYELDDCIIGSGDFDGWAAGR